MRQQAPAHAVEAERARQRCTCCTAAAPRTCVPAETHHRARLLAARRQRAGLCAAGDLHGGCAACARHLQRQRAGPAGPSVAGRGAAVVAAAQLPPAHLLAGRAAAVAAAPLALVPPAGLDLAAAPLAQQLRVAGRLLLGLATPVCGVRRDEGDVGCLVRVMWGSLALCMVESKAMQPEACCRHAWQQHTPSPAYPAVPAAPTCSSLWP